MTPDELRQIVDANVTVSLLVAFQAIGVGETAGRKALKRGDLPFRVIKVGAALRVPAADLAGLLQSGAN